jgi:hypothetical protein
MSHYAIRERTREVMVEIAIRIRALKSSAYDTGLALRQAHENAEELSYAIHLTETIN